MAEIETNTEGPGELLIAARNKLGLTKSDIAKQLNLSLSVVEQLESNNYTGDIPDAFLRGYLRNYARAVSVDEDQIVTLYSEFTGLSVVRNYYVPSADVAPMKIQIGSHLLWFKLLSIAVFIAIIILGWMAYNQTDFEATVTDTAPNSIPLDSEETIEQTVGKPAEISIDSDVTAEQIADDVVQQQPETIQIEEALDTDNIDVDALETEIPQGFVDEPQLTVAELELYFIDDCWVQITDSNDAVLAVGLKSAGRRFSVNGVPPITVVLGKPRAVSLQYNNQSVDLGIYPASQTARFTLGN